VKNVPYIERPNRLLSYYAIFFLGFLYVPVLLLPLFSFNDSIYIAFPIEGWTLEWYREMLKSEPLHAALMNSIRVGAFASVFATFLGVFAAKAVTRYRMPGKGPVIAVVMAPLVIPGVILGLALLIMLNRIGVTLSLYTVTLGHVLICVPFSMATLMSRFEGFDKSMEEASADLGENAWCTFWRVTLPIIGGTDPTLPLFMWAQLRFPNRLPMVLSMGACILVISFIVVFISQWLVRHDRD